MDCISLLDPLYFQQKLKELRELRKNEDEKNSSNEEIKKFENEIERCMYENYYQTYENKAKKQYLPKYLGNASIRSLKEDLIADSFKEGISKFYDVIAQDGQTMKQVNLQNYFFALCYWQLRAQITNHFRLAKKNVDLPDENIIEDDDKISESEWDRRLQLFKAALKALDPNCQRLIKARKLDKVNKTQLASELGISEGFINEAVHRCWKKLKKITNELQNEMSQ